MADNELGATADAATCSRPSDRAPAGLAASRFDQAHIEAAVAAVDATKLQPVIRKAADDLYEQVLYAAQDYLCENMEGNLKSHLAMVEGENARMRRELYEADRIIGGNYMTGETRIAQLRENDAKLVNRLVLIDALQCARIIVEAAEVTLGRSIALSKIDAALAQSTGEVL